MFSPALAPLSACERRLCCSVTVMGTRAAFVNCIELETRTCAPCALLLGGRTLWGVGSAASLGANTGLESEFARAGSVCGAWRRPASASPAVTNVAGDPAELVMLRTRCPLSYPCQNSEVEL